MKQGEQVARTGIRLLVTKSPHSHPGGAHGALISRNMDL